jgi:hypothetical protein
LSFSARRSAHYMGGRCAKIVRVAVLTIRTNSTEAHTPAVTLQCNSVLEFLGYCLRKACYDSKPGGGNPVRVKVAFPAPIRFVSFVAIFLPRLFRTLLNFRLAVNYMLHLAYPYNSNASKQKMWPRYAMGS